jgi:large subunit ribosomal protein L10
VKRSEKNNFVQKMKDELKGSASVIVAHYDGLSVLETDNLRKEMRNNGAKFKITKNRLTKIALADTPYESIADLFTGPTAIAYSSDPVAPAKVSVSFEKKLENFKIIGGSYDGKKIDLDKINFLASLPSLDQIRGILLGLLNAPAQKIASVVQAPGGQLARLVNARSEQLEKSN